jgi:hypothetical protein
VGYGGVRWRRVGSDPWYVGFTPTEFIDNFRDIGRIDKGNGEFEGYSAKVRSFRCLEECKFCLKYGSYMLFYGRLLSAAPSA